MCFFQFIFNSCHLEILKSIMNTHTLYYEMDNDFT